MTLPWMSRRLHGILVVPSTLYLTAQTTKRAGDRPGGPEGPALLVINKPVSKITNFVAPTVKILLWIFT